MLPTGHWALSPNTHCMTRRANRATDRSIAVRYVSGTERCIEGYRARMAARRGVIAPPDRRRILVLTAAFTPMMVVAALPLTAVVAAIVSIVTASWVGLVMRVAVAVGLGYLTARWAATRYREPAMRGWRRWLPLATTFAVAGVCLAEIVSGSRTPDPVIPLWFASMAWVAAFLPLATGVWAPVRRALWAVGPAVTFAAIVFVATQGFSSLRFARAVPDLDVLAQQLVDAVSTITSPSAGIAVGAVVRADSKVVVGSLGDGSAEVLTPATPAESVPGEPVDSPPHADGPFAAPASTKTITCRLIAAPSRLLGAVESRSQRHRRRRHDDDPGPGTARCVTRDRTTRSRAALSSLCRRRARAADRMRTGPQ